MRKAEELNRLEIKEDITVGATVILVNKNKDITTEIARCGNGAVRPIYTNKISGISHAKGMIFEDAKLIWQKAQQQQ